MTKSSTLSFGSLLYLRLFHLAILTYLFKMIFLAHSQVSFYTFSSNILVGFTYEVFISGSKDCLVNIP